MTCRTEWTWLAALPLALAAIAAAADSQPGTVVDVGHFVSAQPTPEPPWRVIRLDDRVPPTLYRTMRWDGVEAVEASAQASMALLARPVRIDLHATPVLCWRWRVERVVDTADMETKRGDDYAARVYVAFQLPRRSMSLAVRAKLALARMVYGKDVPDGAINYVWDNRHPVGTQRPNAYTDRTRMIVLRSGNGEAGGWVIERRNVRDDVIEAFGTDEATLHLVAIAADTDNTGERVRSGFADLRFVEANRECYP